MQTKRWIPEQTDKKDVRLHRTGTKSFYWNKANGQKLTQEQVDIIFGVQHYFVPEEQYNPFNYL